MTKQTILITGATSGIGSELAHQYAGPNTHLILVGRSASRLQKISSHIISMGGTVTLKAIDVREQVAMAAWLKEQDQKNPIDIVYANAGIADGVRHRVYEPEIVSRAIFDTNLYGVLNTVYPLLPGMQARRRGQIAIISSLAGYGPVGSTPSYSGSKAAVRVWGESMRIGLARLGIGFTVICPGFIRSPMTANNTFPMPFLVELPRAVKHIRAGVAANRRHIAFPWPLALLVWIFHFMPLCLTGAIQAKTLPKISDAERK